MTVNVTQGHRNCRALFDKPSLLVKFRVSRRQCEMYIGHARLSVCLSVRRRIPTLLHGPGCNLGNGRQCPLVVHYWADL